MGRRSGALRAPLYARPCEFMCLQSGGAGCHIVGVRFFFLHFVVCVDQFPVLYVCVFFLFLYILGWSRYHSFPSGAAVRLPNPHMFVIVAACVRLAALFVKNFFRPHFRGRGAPPEPPVRPVCLRWGFSSLRLVASVARVVFLSVRIGRNVLCVCAFLSAAGVATRVPATVLRSLFFCVCVASVLLLPLRAASPSVRSSLSRAASRSRNSA